MKPNRQLDETLAALVDEVREPSESIWSWHSLTSGQVSVLLIERRLIPHAERMLAIGLGGGQGRVLEFQQVGSQWSLVRQSRWIA
jgi:hypothetical protein